MTDRETTIRDGQAARAVLDNPAFQRAVDEVRASCVNQFLQSPPEDPAARERAYQFAVTLEALQVRLRAAMDGGDIAAAGLAREEVARKGDKTSA